MLSYSGRRDQVGVFCVSEARLARGRLEVTNFCAEAGPAELDGLEKGATLEVLAASAASPRRSQRHPGEVARLPSQNVTASSLFPRLWPQGQYYCPVHLLHVACY